jgi:anti-sigma B factor antagonist
MQIEERNVGQNLVVKPFDKRIDASVAAQFKGSLIECIRAGHTTVILDLSNVEFIDSSGLGAIVSGLKAVGPAGDLVLCGPRDAVMNLFRLTRMNRVFQIFATEDEAIGALSKQRQE